MRSKLIVVFFVGLFLISSISAVTTPIHIKTMPYHEVQVTLSKTDIDGFVAIEYLKNYSDYYGDVYFEHTGDENRFNYYVFIKLAGETILKEKYLEGHDASEPLDLILVTDGYEIRERPEEELIIEEENIVENSTEILEEELIPEETKIKNSSAIITGFASAVGDIFENKKILYSILGGLGVLVVIVIIFFFVRKMKGKKKEIKITKLSDLKMQDQKIKDKSEKLKEAEQRLKEAQEQYNQIKNEDKIAEMKRKIREDEEELINLRNGREQ